MAQNLETATFGAGCFWGVEETFRKIPGVTETAVGYEGGTSENPTYEDVCTDTTGHAEVVRVRFDPEKISFEDLLDIFWKCHNPTTPNQQGPDVGTQYRSVIFYHNDEQKHLSEKSKEMLAKHRVFKKTIVTQILPAQTFYQAEDYHQKYFEKQGIKGCRV